MNQDNINTITLYEYYMVMSKKTKFPYISENRTSYLFSDEKKLDAFLESAPDTAVAEKKYYTSTQLVNLLYRIGVKTLHVSNDKEDVDISILQKDAEKQFYNNETFANILRLKQFKKKKYLKNLSKSTFIVPVKLDERKEKFAPNIHYAYMSTAESDSKYYVAFTDLVEFEKWNDLVKGNWKPVNMTIRNINNIRNRNPIIINPLTASVALNNSLIKKIIQK